MKLFEKMCKVYGPARYCVPADAGCFLGYPLLSEKEVRLLCLRPKPDAKPVPMQEGWRQKRYRFDDCEPIPEEFLDFEILKMEMAEAATQAREELWASIQKRVESGEHNALSDIGLDQKRIDELFGLWHCDGLDAVANDWWKEQIAAYTDEAIANDPLALKELAEAIADYSGSDWNGGTYEEFMELVVRYFQAKIEGNEWCDWLNEHLQDSLFESFYEIKDDWCLELNSGTAQSDVPAALFSLNRHAKRLRDLAAVAYECDNHVLAGVCRRRKEQIYQQKSLAVAILQRIGAIDCVGITDSSPQFAVFRGAGYCFHVPRGVWNVPDDCQMVAFEGVVESKPAEASEMNIADASATIKKCISTAIDSDRELAAKSVLPERVRDTSHEDVSACFSDDDDDCYDEECGDGEEWEYSP